MNPKEKASDLIEKFEPFVDYKGDDCFTEREKIFINAKRCAFILVNEILNIEFYEVRNYWLEVKQEIENYK